MDFDSLLVVFGVALALGCDAFSVGLALGTSRLDRRGAFRIWFHFGLFQFLMPIIGWWLGRICLQMIASIDHWVAAGFVGFIALRMLIQSLRMNDGSRLPGRSDPTRGWSLVGLSVATSLDALGVGLSMGILNSRLIFPAATIGVMAGGMTFVGIKVGHGLSEYFGKRVETFGALVLFYIAWRLLEI